MYIYKHIGSPQMQTYVKSITTTFMQYTYTFGIWHSYAAAAAVAVAVAVSIGLSTQQQKKMKLKMITYKYQSYFTRIGFIKCVKCML